MLAQADQMRQAPIFERAQAACALYLRPQRQCRFDQDLGRCRSTRSAHRGVSAAGRSLNGGDKDCRTLALRLDRARSVSPRCSVRLPHRPLHERSIYIMLFSNGAFHVETTEPTRGGLEKPPRAPVAMAPLYPKPVIWESLHRQCAMLSRKACIKVRRAWVPWETRHASYKGRCRA